MGDPLQQLVNEFSSLVDEALILSLCLDYDLSIPAEFQQARQALLVVSADVVLEEASGFNASGLGERTIDINDNQQVEPEPSEAGTALSGSDARSPGGISSPSERSMPHTILSGASSHTSVQDIPPTPTRLSLYDGLTLEEKESNLCQVFPELKPIDIRLALRKYDGDADRAVDMLLTTSHLEQSGQRPKGVDGFYVDENPPLTKKKKGKKKKPAVRTNVSTPSTDTSTPNSPAEPSAAETHQRNIAYLADRLPFSESEVKYIYCEKRQSMGAALVQILDNYIEFDGDSLVRARNSASDDEAKKYPWVPAMYLTPAFCLATSRQNAVDLIGILAEYYEKPAYLRYNISYNIAGPRPEQETVNDSKTWASVSRKAPAAPVVQQPSTSTLVSSMSSLALQEKRNHSFQAAGAAYRKGGLMRSAAAVYADRGRDQTQSMHSARSSEAALFVDQRSRPDHIDLHGVRVHDGVNIALDRVRQWWDSLGEERVRKAKSGFTVVTGLGRHSAGGVSQLRVNVFKALVSDGWKVQVLTGEMLVTGRK
ncbi:hypothetical protein BJ166DRAFT_587967 [Pestalotiopsis sp. NC0098]|nr:hypothetical protein BJ166DRAFT_587967 [Pestalotiopsis sp. NC0098]